MSGLRQLTDDAVLLSLHVDALELSCSVEQVPMLYGGEWDELDLKLSRLKVGTRATVPSRPVPTGWQWDEAPAPEPVLLLPSALRKGYRFALACSAWVLFVASPRAVVPRFSVQPEPTTCCGSVRCARTRRRGRGSSGSRCRSWMASRRTPSRCGTSRASTWRPTWPASSWPPRTSTSSRRAPACDRPGTTAMAGSGRTRHDGRGR